MKFLYIDVGKDVRNEVKISLMMKEEEEEKMNDNFLNKEPQT